MFYEVGGFNFKSGKSELIFEKFQNDFKGISIDSDKMYLFYDIQKRKSTILFKIDIKSI